LRKSRHGNRTLTAAQYRAERDHQQLVEVVQSGMPVRGSARPSQQAMN
jgi:hypothetical protein